MVNYEPSKFMRLQKKIDIVKILIDKYRVKKVILIGSCLEYEKFHSHSDIDLCIECLSGIQYFQAVGELLIESDEFDVDLIPIEDSNDRMKEYIKKGKILYERR